MTAPGPTDEQRNPFTIEGADGIDLVAQWIVDPATDEVIGLLARHAGEWGDRFPHCGGGGYIAWRQIPGITLAARHQLVAGGPDDLASLTVSPSLWHRAKGSGSENSPHRGCHGFIRDGRWEIV